MSLANLQSSARVVLHIGPPKTATTSLQECVIPRLGRPFQIKPDWARAIAREATFEAPHTLPENTIVSDERLGGFWTHSPFAIADRLSLFFTNATIVYAKREPLDLFYSLYRQGLLNALGLLKQPGAIHKPALTANDYFDYECRLYRKFGQSFFAMIDLRGIRRAFERHFALEFIDFETLKKDPQTFVAAFTRVCGLSHAPEIGHVNRADPQVIVEEAKKLQGHVDGAILGTFATHYHASKLTPEREALMREIAASDNIAAFVEAFRF